MISFNMGPIAVSAGLAYVLMAVTVWSLLRRSPHAQAVRFWSQGSALGGIGLAMVATRGYVPDLVGYGVPAWLTGAALALQVHALRVHIGLPPKVRVLAALWLLSAVINMATLAHPQRWLHVAVSCSMLALSAATLAWHARQAALHHRSRSAMLVAWSQLALVLALVVRATSVSLGWAVPEHAEGDLDFALLYATATLAALYGSLGFLGMVLDITRRAEVRAFQAQVAEATRREAAESNAEQLRLLLEQRDRLASERERMLQLLAHEIRQPLHNASGALRAASQVLKAPQAVALDQVARRLARAEAVLGDVRSVLDNTLTAATLLHRSAPLLLQEVDLRFLIDLALGDLDEDQRARVQLHWQTDLRLAEVEPGLMRLALRNLLVNAFGHGGPGVVVQLRVDEQTDPPALLLSVVDDGPGLATEAAPPAGVGMVLDADRTLPPQRPGLGLAIVRQVMGLHAGRLDLAAQQPQGLRASLVLPLPTDG